MMKSPENMPTPVVEPSTLVDEAAKATLIKLFPEHKKEIEYGVAASFLIDVLSSKDIPGMLDRFPIDRQKELLLSGTGTATVEEAIKVLFKDIPEGIVEFYRKKLG